LNGYLRLNGTAICIAVGTGMTSSPSVFFILSSSETEYLFKATLKSEEV